MTVADFWGTPQAEDQIEQTEGHERSSWPAADPWRIAAVHRAGRLLAPHRHDARSGK